MLERQRLLLCPWPDRQEGAPSEPVASILSTRNIVEADTRLPLGRASRTKCRSGGWLDWFQSPALDITVHETEDDSLLFTMHRVRRWQFRPWPRPQGLDQEPDSVFRWEIRDAEEHLVGTLEPPQRLGYASSVVASVEPHLLNSTLAYDAAGRCLIFTSEDGSQKSRVLAKEILGATQWSEAGSVSRHQSGRLVEFSSALEGQPFSKMLIVAAALITGT